MSGEPPLQMVYQGEGEFRAVQDRWAQLGDRHYVIGQVYRMGPLEERNGASHRHYFAQVNTAWGNLNEAGVERFPTPDVLRKYALIRTGWRDEKVVVADTPEEAKKLVVLARRADDYSIVSVVDCVVTVYTAKSQAEEYMDGKSFQKSKQAVLDFLAQMLGVNPDTLAKNAYQA